MLILHAACCQSRLWLWAETPGPDYSAGPERIAEALAESGLNFPVRKKTFHKMMIWLPAVSGQPVASSPLIAEPKEGKASILGRPVTALPLETGQALDLLCACAGKPLLRPGVIVGEDLSYWAVAMRFTGAIVAREQFLPALLENRACWKPVYLGPDAEGMRKLAEAMPAAARALSEAPGTQPAAHSAAVLNEFLAVMVDHLVRSSYPRPSVSAPESLHDRWLLALTSPDGSIDGNFAELAAQVGEWQRPLALLTEAPFRLCFRLEEPANGDGRWRIRYLLQGAKDPSLLVPAEKAWGARKNRVLNQAGFDAREYLLLSLGQASRICPRIEASLASPSPAGYEADAGGAHEFLSEKSIALEQAGFGVLLPAWWTRRGTKTRLAARAHVKGPAFAGGGGLSLDQVVQFEWQIALGGEPLTFEELRQLAALKVPLVKIRGQWVEMTAQEIQAAVEYWKKRSGAATLREVVRMALGAGATEGALEFEGVTATGWIADLLAQLEGQSRFEELPSPPGLQATLRPYQVRGYSWLAFLRHWGLGACLADDMGLGKTIQTLSLIERERASGGKRPVLLVCPTSVVGNWQKEAARFTPGLPVMVHHGSSRTRGEAFREQALRHAIVISSYALLHRDLAILQQVPWCGVVLDEAQNIKNPETKQSAAARALPADYRIALTGTPVENNVGDLWSILEFLNPGFLGSRSEFKQRFFLPIQSNRDPQAAERLKRLTGPFVLRRLKTDKSIIQDLPEKMEMKVYCTLTKEQASLYAAVVKEVEQALKSAEGIQRKGLVLATLSKLKQVCNHPAQFLGDNSAIPNRSGKLARLTEMLEEACEAGDRALVFSQFTEMGEIIRRHLQETLGREVLFLHGAVPKKQRDRMVERFQDEEDGPPVFLLSLKAGGTGLNLTRANHVFHFDRWWNPAVENQATDRAFRIGQTRNVQVHKFLCVGTLEEKIDEMIERKKEIAAGVVGAGEAWLTELSNAELKDLFALRREAVAE